MFVENFSNKDETYPLSVGFGGEEGGEETGFGFFVYSFSCVGNLYANRICGRMNVNLSMISNGFGGIFNDIKQ